MFGNKFQFVNKYGLDAKLHLLNFYSRSCWSTPRVWNERYTHLISSLFFLVTVCCVGRKLQILKPTLTHCSMFKHTYARTHSAISSIICAHHSSVFFLSLVWFGSVLVLFSLLGLFVSDSFGSVRMYIVHWVHIVPPVCTTIVHWTVFRLAKLEKKIYETFRFLFRGDASGFSSFRSRNIDHLQTS